LDSAKAIFKYQSDKNSTEYSLCAIPLGGYVQMLESKNPEAKRMILRKRIMTSVLTKKMFINDLL
jgi:membrane-associated protease RseP (regulator of RpoE activity)